jgi:uncharacterized coiled-coil protein SlyX
MNDQSKQWQEIASQGIETERTLRIRIEALEKHKRLQTEDVMNLGAQLGQAWQRIEQLEAALREIIEPVYIGEGGYRVKEIARAALAPEQEK